MLINDSLLKYIAENRDKCLIKHRIRQNPRIFGSRYITPTGTSVEQKRGHYQGMVCKT